MDFEKLVLQNRSYRGFDSSRPVTREELEKLVALARVCPSSVNIQPLKYYLSRDENTNRKILDRIKFAGMLRGVVELPHKGMEPTGYIIVCHDKDISPAMDAFSRDVGIVAQTILLGAVNMGLGGCMLGNFEKEGLHKVLGLGEKIEPVLVIALGKPAEKILLTDLPENGDTKYYRDENDTHYVPKRSVNDLIINK